MRYLMTWRNLADIDPAGSDTIISFRADLIQQPASIDAWVGFSGKCKEGYSGEEYAVQITRNEDRNIELVGDRGFGTYTIHADLGLEEKGVVYLIHADESLSQAYEITQIKPLD